MNDNRVATVTVEGNGRGMSRFYICDEEIGYGEISANIRKLKRGDSPLSCINMELNDLCI